MKTKTTYILSESDKERFRELINFSGPIMKHMDTCCWEWTGKTHGKGYGSFYYKNSGQALFVSAHRVTYFLEYGPIPKNIHILHHCDNPCCVRHSHLFLGTNKDNSLDAAKKGRKTGWDRSRFTEEEIIDIRKRYNSGESQRSLARTYGRGETTIGGVVNYKSYKYDNKPFPKKEGSRDS